MNDNTIQPIADIITDFNDKFGLPRQSGRAPSLMGTIIFRPEFRNPESLRGLEDFSHIWVLFDFSLAHTEKWKPTVRPPRLGGNERIGVFATRSPFRPNHIGLSCLKLESIEKTIKYGTILKVSGIDIVNKTPIYDIKPYIPYADCHPEATGSYSDIHANDSVSVDIPDSLLNRIPQNKQSALLQCLSDNPRPQYQKDSTRIYKMNFSGFEVSFFVDGDVLVVKDIQQEGCCSKNNNN